MRLSIAAEKLGIPSVSVVVPMFHRQAQAVARGMGFPGLQLALYPGAIETHSEEELRRNVAGLFPGMVAAWTRPPEHAAAGSVPRLGAVALRGDFDGINDHYYRQGWTDGLPVVPPTRAKVDAMLAWVERDPDETIAVLPIANRKATARAIAINAVMAGCRPEYMPVLVAAVEAMADPVYQLKDINTTGSIKPFIVVNGPVARQLDINAGTSLMAPGRHSNSTIGRALGLVVRNIAGFREGETSNGCFGWPGSPWVMAEDEANSPWPPYHQDAGCAPGSSAVTAMMMMNMTNQAMTAGDTAEPHLTGLCYKLSQAFGTTFMQMGEDHGSMFVFISPANARVIARDGYSKQAVREYLAANAKLLVEDIDTEFRFTFAGSTDSVHSMALEGRIPREWDRPHGEKIPFITTPRVIHVVVCGSAERNRNLVMRASYCTPVTREIRLPARWTTAFGPTAS
ncbi:MAG TPA: hypothetical protein VEA40_04070 [Ramlibacter sp.]|nr:hypothetical protein [Ramlibacter sp.]